MAVQLENDLFLKACFCHKTDRTPVWLMRQAGRYLPEYRNTRAQAGSFLDLAKNPSYATEVTLQPIDRFESSNSSPQARRWQGPLAFRGWHSKQAT